MKTKQRSSSLIIQSAILLAISLLPLSATASSGHLDVTQRDSNTTISTSEFYATIIDIGTPLLVVDGKVISPVKVDDIGERIDTDGIATLTLMKGASASAYGDKGKNGVALVKLRRDAALSLVPYEMTDTPPVFSGSQGLQKWMDTTINHSAIVATTRNVVVLVLFTIEKDGKVTGGKIFKSFYSDSDAKAQKLPDATSGWAASFEAQALKLLSVMPNWSPGIYKGKTVSVSYMLPIVFKKKEPAAKVTQVPNP